MSNLLTKILLPIIVVFTTAAFANTASATQNTVLDFDGTSDYVVVEDNAVLDQADRLSLSVWIEPDDTPAGDEYILYRQDAYYIKQTSTNTIVGAIWYTAAWHTVTSAAITSDGAAWTHIEMTYDKDATGTDELKLYINGNLEATGDNSTAITAVATKLYIGAGDEVGKDNTPENWFDGQIDGVQLYQYARSAADVRLDYNKGLATHLGPNLKSCSDDPASCMNYGLMGYWKVDEGSGQTAYDASNNGNNGILGASSASGSDDPKWGGGKNGGGIEFDGVNDYVEIVRNSTLEPTNYLTIEAWVKRKGTTEGGIFSRKEWTASTFGYHFSIGDDSGGASLFLGIGNGNPNQAIYSNSLTWGDRFYHIATTYDNGNITLYRNGISIKTGYIAPPISYAEEQNVYMGATHGPDKAYPFNGSIDEVRIYNRVLSAEEIRYHYNRGGPIAYWNFDEGEGTTAYDGSINRNKGTLVGATHLPTWVEGKYGGALQFDGTEDYMDAGNVYNGIKTVSFWVKASDITSHTDYVIDLNGTDYIKIVDGEVTVNNISSPTYYVNVVSGERTISDTTNWHHIAVTTATGINASDLDIARLETIGYFNGSIDDVRIYNYVRSADEILLDYQAGIATHFK